MHRISAIFLCSCLALGACSTQGVGDETSISQQITTPTLGSGAYPLPLNQGWATLSEGFTFNPGNNSLTIAGGATGNGGGGGGYWNTSVPLQVGQSISAVQLTVQDNAGARIFAYIAASDPTSGTVTQWCQGHSDGTGNFQTFSFACTGTVPVGAATLQVTSQGPTATVFGASVQPARVRTFSFYPRVVAMGAAAPWSSVGSGDINDAYLQSTALNSQVFLEIPAYEGDTLSGLTLEAEGTGSVNCLYTLFYGAGMGQQTSIGGPNDLSRASTWGQVSVFAGSQEVAAGGGLILFAQASGAGYRIGKMRATFLTSD